MSSPGLGAHDESLYSGFVLLGMSTCCAYVDGANLFHSAEHLGFRIDYDALKIIICKNRTVMRLNYYDTYENKLSERAFFSTLRGLGYDLKLVKLHKYGSDRPQEKIIDTQIVADSIVDGFRITPDIVVFCCGDKDILPAVEYLMEMGRKVEIIAFKHSMVWVLRTSGAKIIDLTRLRERISRSRGFDDK